MAEGTSIVTRRAEGMERETELEDQLHVNLEKIRKLRRSKVMEGFEGIKKEFELDSEFDW